MVVIIVGLDLLLWRPLVVWSDRFKFEQSGAADVLNSGVRSKDALQGSALVEWLSTRFLARVSAVAWLDRMIS